MERHAMEMGAGHDGAPIEIHLEALAQELSLPDAALLACTARIDEAAPTLLAVLARAADGAPLSEDEALLAFRGLYLLAAARDRDTFHVIMRLLRRPEDEIEKLLGDAVTTSLAHIVASVFHGDSDALLAAIADRSLDQFVRASLLEAATFLTWDGKIERTRTHRFLNGFYRLRLAEDEDYVWVSWLESVALLGFRDLVPIVREAWDAGLITEGVLEWHHFERDLTDAEQKPDEIGRFAKFNGGYVDDVVEALEWTRHWGDETPDPLPRRASGPRPAINPWRDVGRNDRCPCGSGKKAKKCCLATQ